MPGRVRKDPQAVIPGVHQGAAPEDWSFAYIVWMENAGNALAAGKSCVLSAILEDANIVMEVAIRIHIQMVSI